MFTYKKLVAFFLAVAITVAVLPFNAFAIDEAKALNVVEDGYVDYYDVTPLGVSGTWGNLSWELDAEGTLTISGEGDMEEVSSDEAWRQHSASIKNVVISDGVANIGNYAFENCKSLVSAVIPDSVTSIGHRVFYRCSSLVSVDIPDGVTSIGKYVFYECSSLVSIDIPNKVMSIDYGTFYGCTSLVSIDIPDGVTSIGHIAFDSCTNLVSVNFPNSVEYIDSYAFGSCTSLVSVDIPDSVTYIGFDAFYNCTSLADISLGSGITYIGTSVFLDTAYYNDKNNWENGAFYFDNYLLDVEGDFEGAFTVKDGTTLIAEDAFKGCTSLVSIDIPDSVTSICDEAFYGCSSLVSIDIPDSVTYLGAFAFHRCTSLTDINLGSGITTIGDGAFSITAYYDDESNWKNGGLYVGNYLIAVEEDFEGEFTVKAGTTLIAKLAFVGALSVTSVVIPVSLKTICEYVVYDSNNIDTVKYCGSEEEWEQIVISEGNDSLTNATFIFNHNISFDLKGDVTGDGKVNALDAAFVLRYDAGLIGADELNLEVADVTGDGKTNALDAAFILRYDAGLIPAL